MKRLSLVLLRWLLAITGVAHAADEAQQVREREMAGYRSEFEAALPR